MFLLFMHFLYIIISMENHFSWNKNVENASTEFTRESARVFQLIQIQ